MKAIKSLNVLCEYNFLAGKITRGVEETYRY